MDTSVTCETDSPHWLRRDEVQRASIECSLVFEQYPHLTQLDVPATPVRRRRSIAIVRHASHSALRAPERTVRSLIGSRPPLFREEEQDVRTHAKKVHAVRRAITLQGAHRRLDRRRSDGQLPLALKVKVGALDRLGVQKGLWALAKDLPPPRDEDWFLDEGRLEELVSVQVDKEDEPDYGPVGALNVWKDRVDTVKKRVGTEWDQWKDKHLARNSESALVTSFRRNSITGGTIRKRVRRLTQQLQGADSVMMKQPSASLGDLSQWTSRTSIDSVTPQPNRAYPSMGNLGSPWLQGLHHQNASQVSTTSGLASITDSPSSSNIALHQIPSALDDHHFTSPSMSSPALLEHSASPFLQTFSKSTPLGLDSSLLPSRHDTDTSSTPHSRSKLDVDVPDVIFEGNEDSSSPSPSLSRHLPLSSPKQRPDSWLHENSAQYLTLPQEGSLGEDADDVMVASAATFASYGTAVEDLSESIGTLRALREPWADLSDSVPTLKPLGDTRAGDRSSTHGKEISEAETIRGRHGKEISEATIQPSRLDQFSIGDDLEEIPPPTLSRSGSHHEDALEKLDSFKFPPMISDADVIVDEPEPMRPQHLELAHAASSWTNLSSTSVATPPHSAPQSPRLPCFLDGSSVLGAASPHRPTSPPTVGHRQTVSLSGSASLPIRGRGRTHTASSQSTPWVTSPTSTTGTFEGCMSPYPDEDEHTLHLDQPVFPEDGVSRHSSTGRRKGSRRGVPHAHGLQKSGVHVHGTHTEGMHRNQAHEIPEQGASSEPGHCASEHQIRSHLSHGHLPHRRAHSNATSPPHGCHFAPWHHGDPSKHQHPFPHESHEKVGTARHTKSPSTPLATLDYVINRRTKRGRPRQFTETLLASLPPPLSISDSDAVQAERAEAEEKKRQWNAKLVAVVPEEREKVRVTDVLWEQQVGLLVGGMAKYTDRLTHEPWLIEKTLKPFRSLEPPSPGPGQIKSVKTCYTRLNYPLPTPDWTWETPFSIVVEGDVDVDGWSYQDCWNGRWRGDRGAARSFRRRRKWVAKRVREPLQFSHLQHKLDGHTDADDGSIMDWSAVERWASCQKPCPEETYTAPADSHIPRFRGEHHARQVLPLSFADLVSPPNVFSPFLSFERVKQIWEDQRTQREAEEWVDGNPSGKIKFDETMLLGVWKDALARVNYERVKRVLAHLTEAQKVDAWKYYVGKLEPDADFRPRYDDVWQVLERFSALISHTFFTHSESQAEFETMIADLHNKTHPHHRVPSNEDLDVPASLLGYHNVMETLYAGNYPFWEDVHANFAKHLKLDQKPASPNTSPLARNRTRSRTHDHEATPKQDSSSGGSGEILPSARPRVSKPIPIAKQATTSVSIREELKRQASTGMSAYVERETERYRKAQLGNDDKPKRSSYPAAHSLERADSRKGDFRRTLLVEMASSSSNTSDNILPATSTTATSSAMNRSSSLSNEGASLLSRRGSGRRNSVMSLSSRRGSMVSVGVNAATVAAAWQGLENYTSNNEAGGSPQVASVFDENDEEDEKVEDVLNGLSFPHQVNLDNHPDTESPSAIA